MPIKNNEPGRIEAKQEELWWTTDSAQTRIGNLVKCFPESAPDSWLSLRDDNGNELTLVGHLDQLDPNSRAAIEPILFDKYHIPTITRLISVDPTDTGKQIEADTLAGREIFNILSEGDVDFRCYPVVLFTDKSQSRKYRIENALDLDKESRDLIRRHLRVGGRRGRGFR